MPSELEYPLSATGMGWNDLYRARGDEVNPHRPVFTGDVYSGLRLTGSNGKVKTKDVIVIQHPCAMRTDGANLIPQLLVAEVTRRSLTAPEQWGGNYTLFPMPRLSGDLVITDGLETEGAPDASIPGPDPHLTNDRKLDRVADFTRLQLVGSELLLAAAVAGTEGAPNGAGGVVRRVASLSELGIDLLLQRWVHHSSRVVVPVFQFFQACQPQFEEADVIEDWCDELGASLDITEGDRLNVGEATRRAVEQLTVQPEVEAVPGVPASVAEVAVSSLQTKLKDPQNHSTVRRAMRQASRDLTTEAAGDPAVLGSLVLTASDADAPEAAAGE